VIEDPNPLSELISFQHTADLAGKAANYAYIWRSIGDVGGVAPTSDPAGPAWDDWPAAMTSPISRSAALPASNLSPTTGSACVIGKRTRGKPRQHELVGMDVPRAG